MVQKHCQQKTAREAANVLPRLQYELGCTRHAQARTWGDSQVHVMVYADNTCTQWKLSAFSSFSLQNLQTFPIIFWDISIAIHTIINEHTKLKIERE